MTSEITVSEQLVSFFLYCLTGGAAGIIYDIFRVLRRDISRNSSAALITDIFTAVSVFVFSLVAFYAINGMRIMFYHIIGYFLGGIIYFLALSPLIYPILKNFFVILKKILNFLLYPVRFSCIMILRVCVLICKPFKRIPAVIKRLFCFIRERVRFAFGRFKKI